MSIPEKLQLLVTIRDFIRWGSSEFSRQQLDFGHGFATAFDEARYLVLHSLSLPTDFTDPYLDAKLTLDERQRVLERLQLRASSRMPAAYITQESWFCGLNFYVDQRVLIPRSPIAELVAGFFEPWVDASGVGKILDLCTGSGCIAIAAKYHFPDAQVSAADLSPDALEERHDLSGRLNLIESDLFAAIPPQEFDIIVTNPPYVDAEDMAALTDEFRFEPVLGLQAGGDGLEIVGRILAQAESYLSETGVLFLEVGNSQLALTEKYDFLPITWLEFEFGGCGVCCVQASDLTQHQSALLELAS